MRDTSNEIKDSNTTQKSINLKRELSRPLSEYIFKEIDSAELKKFSSNRSGSHSLTALHHFQTKNK